MQPEPEPGQECALHGIFRKGVSDGRVSDGVAGDAGVEGEQASDGTDHVGGH